MIRYASRLKYLVVVAIAGAYLHLGCIAGEEGNESRQAALGTFGLWQSLGSGGGSQDAPAIAKVGTVAMQAFGFGVDGVSGQSGQIINSYEVAGGGWSPWTELSNNGGPFRERPAAVGLGVTAGPLLNCFALIGRRTDNRYYARIQNSAGVVLEDWAPIGSGIYTSAPAVAFVPRASLTSPRNAIVVVGLGTDGHFWQSINRLTASQTYLVGNWSGPSNVFPEQLFDSPPALTYAYPQVADAPSLAVVGRIGGGTFRASWFNGASWSGWTSLNGQFTSGPAIAGTIGEITVYGVSSADTRMYVSTPAPGAPGGVSLIGAATFFSGTPTATGFLGRSYVSANQAAGGGSGTGPISPFINSASSP